jgi:tetratricopeptide (TPR) repeat protein
MRINKFFVVVITAFVMFALPLQQEASAQTGESDIESEEICKNAPLAGASKVYVVVKENDNVLLVGMKGKTAVWRKSFPLREDVNKAKTFVECQGQRIELHAQQPFSAAEIIQTFSWDGRRLRYVATRYEDPSAEFIEEMLRAAEKGDTKTLRPFLENDPAEGTVEVMYPYAYINRRLFVEAIRRGHTAATRLFKLGRAREAAVRLSLMFDVTAALDRIVSGDEAPSKKPDKWLAAWKSQEMEAADYVYALNDYGFFMQEAGDSGAAINIFAAVIQIDPKRAVAYLNLADSLWTLDRKAEARAHYKTYQQLMNEENRQSQIPARVAERLS